MGLSIRKIELLLKYATDSKEFQLGLTLPFIVGVFYEKSDGEIFTYASELLSLMRKEDSGIITRYCEKEVDTYVFSSSNGLKNKDNYLINGIMTDEVSKAIKENNFSRSRSSYNSILEKYEYFWGKFTPQEEVFINNFKLIHL